MIHFTIFSFFFFVYLLYYPYLCSTKMYFFLCGIVKDCKEILAKE